jgi:hypothetical protein
MTNEEYFRRLQAVRDAVSGLNKYDTMRVLSGYFCAFAIRYYPRPVLLDYIDQRLIEIEPRLAEFNEKWRQKWVR